MFWRHILSHKETLGCQNCTHTHSVLHRPPQPHVLPRLLLEICPPSSANQRTVSSMVSSCSSSAMRALLEDDSLFCDFFPLPTLFCKDGRSVGPDALCLSSYHLCPCSCSFLCAGHSLGKDIFARNSAARRSARIHLCKGRGILLHPSLHLRPNGPRTHQTRRESERELVTCEYQRVGHAAWSSVMMNSLNCFKVNGFQVLHLSER